MKPAAPTVRSSASGGEARGTPGARGLLVVEVVGRGMGRAQSRSAGWLVAVWSETFSYGPQRGLRARGEVELAQDVAHVGTSSALADHQLRRDLLVGLAARHHAQDLSLPIGELRPGILRRGRPHR